MSHMELIKELTDAGGVSGYEGRVAVVIEKHLSGVAEITRDNLGSVICKNRGGDGPKIMLPGHMDEVGFIVNKITQEGFIKFYQIGGWWDQVLLFQKVVIQTRKGDVKGLLAGAKPPHILDAKEREKVFEKKDMYIDIGATSAENAAELGVRPGDPVVPDTTFDEYPNGMVVSKALDDRIGCALFIDLIQALKDSAHPNTVYGVGTAQEEVGLRGATTAANIIQPDICITLEGVVPTDTPGLEKENWECSLGKGPAICIADSSVIGNRYLREFIADAADSENIPLQLSFLFGGGTDAGVVHKTGPGVPSVVFGVPLRYVHAHYGMFNQSDYENALKLLVAVIKKLDNDAAARIKRGC